MSKLTELLDELCPDGVEYHTLDEVFDTRNGYTPSRSKPEFWVDEGIPWFRMDDIRTNGNVLDDSLEHISPEAVKGTVFPAGTVIVATSATIGEHALLKVPALSNQRFTALIAKPEFAERLLPEFVHYYCFVLDEWCTRNTTQSSFASVDMPRFRKFMFPVPPLEVQQEIVRVLDAFTDLEQSLVSELELRKKQLNDYRHAHFANIKETDGCAVTLGEIAEVRSGWGFPKAYQGTLSGDLPFFKVGDMNLPGNETFLHSANNYISDTQAQELKVKPAPTGSIVFPKVGAAIATNKKRILTQESAFDNNVMSLVPGQKVDSDFLFHWIQTEDLVRWGNSSGGVPSIRKSDVEKVTLILPPREQQEVVASRLNVFSNLIQSIEQEISLRRQQYEFYRDELLSFTPKED